MAINPKQVQTLFLAAVELASADERAAFLDRECGHDQELRRRVEALLLAHDDPASLPAAGAFVAETSLPVSMHAAGTLIAGRYKLLEQIGEGGMGAVWVAEQTEPVRRRVALKLIKPGMDTKQVLSRFAAERQALALMDHPNIAKVYDGGMTEEGRPFFVMEYVKGVPITEYCDQARLSIDDRLKLFLPICQAVQHAHQKGIIHRDLKPSNLLVCLYDGRPVPKVIDFGLAKAISQPLTEHTLYTAHGLMVGTPLYMSPEQAEFNNLDVDTRTDIYSLGVILYELLTGTTPLEKQKFKDAAFQEILRLIKEEEPPRPSTKLSGSASLPAVAAQRGLEPAQLSRVVRGELDWIVMKSLEKERSRRYETASGLTRDLERYLHDEPVEACPPSLSYRASKFARRNMRALVTGSLFGLVVMASLIAVAGSVGWAVRDRQTREAVVERKILLALDKAKTAYDKDNLPATRSAVQQAEGLLASADARPEVTSQVRQWVADLEMVDRLARIHLDKSLTLKDDHFDLTSAPAHYVKAFEDYGLDLATLSSFDAAQKLKSSLIHRHLVAGLDDWAIAAGGETGERLFALTRQVDTDHWRQQMRSAVENDDARAFQKLAADDACLAQHPTILAALAARLSRLDDRQPASSLLRRALARYPDDYWLNVHQGNLLLLNFQPDEAVVYLRLASAKAPGSPATRNSLGAALSFTNKLADAAEEFRAAIRLQPTFAMPHLNLGSILLREGRAPEAEPLFREAVRLRPQDSGAYAALAECLGAQKKYAESDNLYRQAMALDPDNWSINTDYLDMLDQARLLAAAEAEVAKSLVKNPNLPRLHRFLGDLRWQANNIAGAEQAYRDALRLNPQDWFGHTRLAAILLGQEKHDDAVAALEEALRLQPDSAWSNLYLGAALSRQSRWKDAEPPLRKAQEKLPDHFVVYILLSQSIRSQGKSPGEMPRRTATAITNVGNTPFARPATSVKTYFELGALEQSSPIRTRDRSLLPRSSFGPSPDTARRSRVWEAQETELRAAIQRNPRDIAAREKLAALLLQYNPSALYQTMWDAICTEPSNAKFHAYLGAGLGSPAYSEAALRESIRLDSGYAFAHHRLAIALERQGRLEEAVGSAREAVRLDPRDPDHHATLARCLMRQGQWSAAEASYREELRLRPQNPSGHYDLGWVLFRLGKKTAADAEFALGKQQASNLTNSPFASHGKAGSRSASLGLFWQAIEDFKPAVKEDPADDAAAVRAALLQLYLGDRSAYEATCKQMIDQCARTTDGHTQRRTLHACLITPDTVGDQAQHQQALEAALSGTQDLRMMLYVRGLFEYRNGQWAEAIKFCRQSREETRRTKGTQMLEAHNLMVEAMALHQQGKSAEARKAYEQASRYAASICPFAPHLLGSAWVDWLSYEFNRREAAPLLGIEDQSGWPHAPGRARRLAAEGDWQAGATELARACTSPAASSLDFIAAGTLLARAGDKEGYRRHSQAMIDRFIATQDWQEIERTVKVCALAPFGLEIPSELVDAVSKDLDANKLETWMLTWGNTARAMAAYRLGRIEDAAKWAEAAASEVNSNTYARIQGFLIAAMAQYRRGDTNAAKDRLLTATQMRSALSLPRLPDGSPNERLIVLEWTAWWDVLCIELMLREAQSLMEGQPASTLPAAPSENAAH